MNFDRKGSNVQNFRFSYVSTFVPATSCNDENLLFMVVFTLAQYRYSTCKSVGTTWNFIWIMMDPTARLLNFASELGSPPFTGVTWLRWSFTDSSFIEHNRASMAPQVIIFKTRTGLRNPLDFSLSPRFKSRFGIFAQKRKKKNGQSPPTTNGSRLQSGRAHVQPEQYESLKHFQKKDRVKNAVLACQLQWVVTTKALAPP